MNWWEWVFLWATLVAVTAWTMFLLGRSLWRRAMALLTELDTASERFSALSDELGALQTAPSRGPELAVFADPAELRRERAAGGRHRARHRTPAGAPPRTHRTG